jgi:hypothetical protein
MTRRSGSADLPLHGGQVPRWLADRMTRLGAIISEAIIHSYGRDELLRRLADPFWFQSFGAVMGMDWHSSGITTSVIGALKRGLTPLGKELGVHVCGGRGKHSRQTPQELVCIGERVGIDGTALAQASRLVAKVDSAAVQDGFDLYLHGFIVTDDGKWAVVQQGMNGGRKQSRQAQLDLLSTLGPDKIAREFSAMATRGEEDAKPPIAQPLLPHLIMPSHHEVRSSDVIARRLHGNLAAAADRGPKDFPDLLLTPGVGARTVRALAWWRKLCMARHTVSQIPRGSRLRTAVRTATPFRCRSRSMMKRSGC